VGLSSHRDAFGIEGIVGEKMVSSSFGRAASSEMRTPGVMAGKPWVLSQTRAPHGDTLRSGFPACVLGQHKP